MVSTLDFESSDPSSNLGGTSQNIFSSGMYVFISPINADINDLEDNDQNYCFGLHFLVRKELKWSMSGSIVVELLSFWSYNAFLNPCPDMLHFQWKNVSFSGGSRSWTGDLSICSRMLCHWAIPPSEIWAPHNITSHSRALYFTPKNYSFYSLS